jgi:hypothetical protein
LSWTSSVRSTVIRAPAVSTFMLGCSLDRRQRWSKRKALGPTKSFTLSHAIIVAPSRPISKDIQTFFQS